jgi:hypothetical protein
MSIITWTRRARCKDCFFLVAFSPNGKTKRHYCSNRNSEQHDKLRTLKDLVCDKWKLM